MRRTRLQSKPKPRAYRQATGPCQVQGEGCTGQALQYISRGDVVREGFPHMTRDQFLDFYTTTFGVDRGTWVTRIEWRYLDNRSGS